ncbi:MAG: hypothetical protein COZ18_05920 [Flexibacter sp. CG_4_10_14_3_um_filter_32_15]|nr:MAG: hypothetical protein COZ18_05920 [Flexibacter sp. CG_4_10_14_3_um_filter_32_15]
MNYNTHKLNSQNHSHIIGRQDSVTGNAIKVNDEVVFCSACQSVFLKESWEDINKEHCNQTETLGFVPLQEKKIKIEKKESLLFEITPNTKKYRQSIIFSYFCLFFCTLAAIVIAFKLLTNENLEITKKIIGLSLIPLYEIGVIFGLRNFNKNAKKECHIGIIPLQLYQDKIILFDKLYKWEESEGIAYKSNIDTIVDKTNIPNKLEIYVKNEILDINLPSKYPHNTKLLTKLVQLSEYIKVDFYTDDKKEYQFIKEKEENYEINIILTKKRPFY